MNSLDNLPDGPEMIVKYFEIIYAGIFEIKSIIRPCNFSCSNQTAIGAVDKITYMKYFRIYLNIEIRIAGIRIDMKDKALFVPRSSNNTRT
jgi:hypothetical protein